MEIHTELWHSEVNDLYNLNSVERVKVSRNSHGQSIGSEARVLAGYLGIIARNVNLLPINYESCHHMPDSNKNHTLDNIKDCERVGTTSRKKQKFTHTTGSKSFACVANDKELSSGQKVGLFQLFDITHRKKYRSPMTVEATEIMEKLKDKRVEYETTASNDSSVNLDNIDNQVITAQAEVQRLRDQMAQMQTSTVQKIAQLKVAVESREAEAKRKYNEL
ncbi:hypothetical protein GOBAR_AA08835 [Gossypium barbadense]|uniref:Uncharacterized protein n=1 Tax=Gossypium barbadense TaxID=3634 RepID=A0A2P5Y8A6_GOSBA|nr:hypothetical protein GOBAR_AA08835 [Gossypium barbadense]